MNIFRIIFLIFFIYFINSSDSDIVFVYEHVRHGARSPLFLNGNTKYLDAFGTQWEGASTLTNVGKREHYVLGIHNRLKYSSLINFTKYDYQEIKVYSTNSGRTIQSIQAELHAMYLPGTIPKLTKEQLLAAYPPFQNLSSEVLDEVAKLNDSTIINDINVFPIQMSDPKKVRLNEPENCPFMKQYQAELENKTRSGIIIDFVKNFTSKYGEKLKQVLNKTDKDINDFDYIEIDLAEDVLCNYNDGNNLTDFIKKTGFDLDEFIEDNRLSKNIHLYHMNIDEKTGIMSASPSMREIINYMDNIINNKSQAPKMVMQGGHDDTISYFQYFMKHVFNIPIQYIPFASNIYFELHKNKSESDKFYIEYILDGVTKLKMDYPEFKTKVLEAVWSDEKINKFCYPPEKEDEKTDENKTEYEKYKTYTIALLSTTIFLFISTVVFIILFILFYKKTKKYSGNLLTNDSTLNGKANNELQLIE